MSIAFKEIIENIVSNSDLVETSIIKKSGKTETVELKNISNNKTYSIKFKNDTKDSGAYIVMISISNNKLYYESFYTPEFQSICNIEFAVEQYIINTVTKN